jgi:hypothetical protein
MMGSVLAVGEVDAVEAMVACTLNPSLDRPSADVKLLGDGTLRVAAPDRGDDVAASSEVGLFLLMVILS